MTTNEQVGIQGFPGANHEIAARNLYGDAVDLAYIPTFKELFDSLRERRIGRAVVAFSNTSTEGAFIPAPHRELIKNGSEYWLTDRVDILVRHQLLTLPGARLDQISTVHSMGVALEQCEETLRRILPNAQLIHEDDTALSAQLVKERNDTSHAAVATTLSGELNDLVIAASDIQDDSQNITRFFGWSLREEGLARMTGNENRTLILIKPPNDHAGTLLRVLQPFDSEGINLADLHVESSPGSGRRTKQFLIEAESGFETHEMQQVLATLAYSGYTAALLGSWVESTQESAT